MGNLSTVHIIKKVSLFLKVFTLPTILCNTVCSSNNELFSILMLMSSTQIRQEHFLLRYGVKRTQSHSYYGDHSKFSRGKITEPHYPEQSVKLSVFMSSCLDERLFLWVK